jgi:hypothetical protein
LVFSPECGGDHAAPHHRVSSKSGFKACRRRFHLTDQSKIAAFSGNRAIDKNDAFGD